MSNLTLINICKITLFLLVLMSFIQHVVIASSSPKKLQIGIKKRPTDCPIKSKKGDLLHMHYTVSDLFVIQQYIGLWLLLFKVFVIFN